MSINRRDLIKFGGATAAGLALVGSATRFASAQGATARGMVDLSSNENPYGPAPVVREIIRDTIVDSNRYGFRVQNNLVKKIADSEGVSADHIVLGAGSTEVLNASVLAYTGSGRQLLTVDQGFTSLTGFAMGIGTEVVYAPVDDQLRYDLNAVNQRITNRTGLVYICNPNNPTGTVVDSDLLRDFCASASTKATVLVDEAYLEFTDNFSRDSVIDLVKNDQDVMLCRTFSKIHGLAGLRVGYCIARPDIAARIRASKMCRFMGPLGVAAASMSLEQSEFHAYCRARVKEGRELVFNLCDELGLDYARGAGNFVFLNPGIPHDEFRRRMREKGVNTARAFAPRRDWSRVTMGTTEEMQVFAEVLPEVVKNATETA